MSWYFDKISSDGGRGGGGMKKVDYDYLHENWIGPVGCEVKQSRLV